MSIKNKIKKMTPEHLLLMYHKVLAYLAAFYYGYPTKKMIVVGITGTKGKTSTANFVWSVLNSASYKVGLLGTANIRIGDKESLNPYHMTMPGPFITQKILKQMKDAGCTHVVMEATSEGMKLHRHVGIFFDVAIFTNLTPEHLPNHGGSFEKYKVAKTPLFSELYNYKKNINGKNIQKIVLTNADSEFGNYYANFKADVHQSYGLHSGDIVAKKVETDGVGISFYVGENKYHLNIAGLFNAYNALPAIALAHLLNISEEKIVEGLANLKIIPGRMENIDCAQDFTVIVDYAHEKISMNLLLDTALAMRKDGQKIIILLGAAGGGRDIGKRELMGIAVGDKADYVVVSNEDPYDDDPVEIAEGIARHARLHGKKDGENLFVILDRREGIKKALSLAGKGDIVLISGKGAEQTMVIKENKIPWDDRVVVREELNKLK